MYRVEDLCYLMDQNKEDLIKRLKNNLRCRPEVTSVAELNEDERV